MRRFATIFLVLCLALNLPGVAFAQAASNSPVRPEEGVSYFLHDPVDLEELVSLHSVGLQLDSLDENGNARLKEGNYVRYIDRIDIPDYAMTLYKTLEEGADGDGTADILIDVTKAELLSGMYVISAGEITGSFSNEADLEAKLEANFAEAGSYAYAVIGAFDRDHPEVFWLSGRWSTTYSVSYSSYSKTYTQKVYLILKFNAINFDVRLADYTDPGTLKAAIAERDANVQAILDGMPATAITNADKMRYFNEWLTHNNEYNTAVSSGNSTAAWEMAWECISALQGNSGVKGPVCEAYARAFQVLCNEVNIPCVLVSGNTQDVNTGALNGHMWNYVQLDGSWYGVDVTWNDPVGSRSGKVSGYERENYLFVGASTVATTGGRTFLAEHPVENNIFPGRERFTNGPILSNTAYTGVHTHTFGTPTFNWAADGKSATAVFTCTADPAHTLELAADVTAADKTDATCTSMGTTTYMATVYLNGSYYSDLKKVQDVPALGHDWGDWVQTKAPTETETGEETHTCKRDPSHTETRTIPALGHDLTFVPAKNATCTEPGNQAYYVCNGCGKWFEDAAGTKEITDKNSVVIPVTAHTPAAAVKENEIAATCEKAGSYDEVIYCSKCGAELSRAAKTIPALGHDWGDWVQTKAPTETETGEETRTCKHDPSHTETRTIPALGHDLTLVPAKNATCTEPGNQAYYVCNGCGKWFEDAAGTKEITDKNSVVIPVTAHTPATAVKENEVAATCEKTGSYDEVIYCSKCGAELSRAAKTISALGHDWGDWVQTKAPTETETGEETRTCKHDPSHTETREIPVLAHVHSMTLVPAKDATCTEPGNQAYYVCNGCGKWFEDAAGTKEITDKNSVVIPVTAHTPAAAVKENEVAATCEKAGSYDEVIYCSKCGAELSRAAKTIPALGHDWGDWVQTKAPTETETGEETRTCKHDPSHTETREIPVLAHVHSMTLVPAKDATCTEPGNQAYYVCNGCGKWFEDAAGTKEITDKNSIVIPVTAHTPAAAVKENEVAATCEKDGSYDEVIYCSKCGAELSRTAKTIPALGHDLTLVPAKNATCTEPGNQAYYVCNECGKWFEDAEGTKEITDKNSVVIPVTAHTPAAAVKENEVAATCEKAGSYDEVIYCSKCGAELSRTAKTIPALGHDWGDWVQTKAPTETETGAETRTCKHDPGHTETRDLPALGHSLTFVPAKDATETEAGNTAYYVCNGCGKWFEDAEGTKEITDKNSVVIPAIGPARLLGDVDGNGLINAKDYMLLKRYVLGTFKLTDEQKAAADVNRSGKIESIDYLLLKRHVLKLYFIVQRP